jgi:translation initiation factor 6
MVIFKDNIYGGPNIGTYTLMTNKIFLYPPQTSPSILKFIQESTSLEPIELLINNSTVLGVYAAANSNGMIISHFVRDTEIDLLKKHLPKDFTIIELESEDNAYGNLILCNDKGAIISPLLVDYKEIIEKTLKVPCKVFHFAGSKLPGSCALANNQGVVIHPMATEKEAEEVAKALQVENIDVSTINCGNPFLRGGAVVNNQVGIFGRATTGPEMARITEILHLE